MDFCDVPIPAVKAGCLIAGGPDALAGGVLSALGDTFAHAAQRVLDAAFAAISAVTTVDLSAGYVTSNFAALVSVAVVLVVGLFVVQVVTAALRQQPGELGRALTGAAVAVLGTAVVVAVTQSLLIAVDQVSDGVAALAGTSIEGAARRLVDAQLLLGLSGSAGGAALMVVFGVLFIIGATLLLGTLLVRKALLIVAIVVAPLALAGGTARVTSGWVRRWVQVTLALALSKLAIVIVFVVAVGMLGSADGIGALLSGLILLLLACLAPWACFKVLDFAGTHVASEWHRSTNGATLSALAQGRVSARSMMRTVAPIVGGPPGAAAAAAAGQQPRPAFAPPRPQPLAAPTPPPAATPPATATAGPSSGTSAPDATPPVPWQAR